MRGTIAFTRALSSAYTHLGLAVPGFPAGFRPGQFVMVRPVGVGDPLLPRAFSLYRLDGTADGIPVVELLVKRFGRGTGYLMGMVRGQGVELLGPLGNGFTPPAGGTPLLVAGGVGVPPIAALARALAPGAGAEPPSAAHGPSSMVVFLGGKTAEDILCRPDFEVLGLTPRVTTEDGSLGSRGLITDLLAPFLSSSPAPPVIYTCGPPGMLAAVARLAAAHGVPCQASVEANMACGFGACMGCAIALSSEEPGRRYALVCKDGPVFDSRELAWGGEPGRPRGCGCHRPAAGSPRP